MKYSDISRQKTKAPTSESGKLRPAKALILAHQHSSFLFLTTDEKFGELIDFKYTLYIQSRQYRDVCSRMSTRRAYILQQSTLELIVK